MVDLHVAAQESRCTDFDKFSDWLQRLRSLVCSLLASLQNLDSFGQGHGQERLIFTEGSCPVKLQTHIHLSLYKGAGWMKGYSSNPLQRSLQCHTPPHGCVLVGQCRATNPRHFGLSRSLLHWAGCGHTKDLWQHASRTGVQYRGKASNPDMQLCRYIRKM